ncbi:hypothetical protein [Gluconobacter oxydans]|uniref:structural cement protein Gp24 n=1 Tax=Gluconobacter oxydans TaxID=442 RepID=UPI00062C5BD3|nr:hypothetical protein [Gluconobacter oxydans]
MGFQTSVNQQPAIGVPGDFASNNPTATVLAGEGALVAGSGGVTVAAFAWIGTDGKTVTNVGTTAPDGFVHRELQGLIANIYDEATMLIPAGYMVSLYAAGDFFAVSKTAATRGQKVFASTADGSISTGAVGATVTGAIETPFYVGSAGAAGDTIKITTWDHH